MILKKTKPFLTIFTPTYNRAHLLKRVFKSLTIQEDSDFEWLIIDDGSVDNTSEVVQEILGNKIDFKIIYDKQVNQGKHIAMNRAIELAEGEFFMCLDSDDWLTENAISEIRTLTKLGDEYNTYGVVGMSIYSNGNYIGVPPKKLLVSDTIEIRDKYKIRGEPEIYLTSILKPYSFPKFNDERFLTEAYLFDQITSVYKLLYSDRKLMIKEFQKDGLTSKEPLLRIMNPIGTLEYYKQRFRLSRTIKGKVKSISNYYRFKFHSKPTIVSNFPMAFSVPGRLVGFIYYIFDMATISSLENRT
jgi:glycosyltransferase involved in cell wall biosynthesis